MARSRGLWVLGLFSVALIAGLGLSYQTYPQQTGSYIVWGDPPAAPTVYYAKNGMTGAIDYSGTDFSTVMQNSIDSIITDGSIFIKVGIYNVTSQINLVAGLKIEGEGKGTILKVKNGYSDTAILDGTGGIYHVILENFMIDGSGADNYKGFGVYFHYVKQFIISNLWIVDTGHTAIYIYGDSDGGIIVNNYIINPGINFCSGIKIHFGPHDLLIGFNDIETDIGYGSSRPYYGIELIGPVEEISISNNELCNFDAAGIYLSGIIEHSHFVSNDIDGGPGCGIVLNDVDGDGCNSFVANDVHNCYEHGVVIDQSSDQIFTANTIQNNGQTAGTWAGIFVNDDGVDISQNNTLTSNRIYESHDYGVWLNSSSTGNLVQNNILTGNIIQGVYESTSGTNRVGSNLGFITENNGNATLAAVSSSITINHGCGYTPILGDIQVTPSRDLGNCTYYWMDTITSTQFTIHVGAGGAAKNINKIVYFLWSVRRH